MKKVKRLLDMIKFEHTIFALPFALLALFLAAEGLPSLETLFWVLVAMVGARSSALAMNRIVDRDIDAANPRTADRTLPRGLVRVREAWVLALVTAGVFVFAAWRLNTVTFWLSPIALAAIWGYSWTKRFTWASHLWLGVSLGLAPLGAWLAVRGRLDSMPLVLGAGVVFWVAGFDTLYACQDVEFDRRQGLFSLPARFGVRRALHWARAFHALMLVAFVSWGLLYGFGWLYWVGLSVVAALVGTQHALVRSGRMRHIDVAFFNVNSMVGVLLLTFTLADQFLG